VVRGDVNTEDSRLIWHLAAGHGRPNPRKGNERPGAQGRWRGGDEAISKNTRSKRTEEGEPSEATDKRSGAGQKLKEKMKDQEGKKRGKVMGELVQIQGELENQEILIAQNQKKGGEPRHLKKIKPRKFPKRMRQRTR